MLFVSDMPTYAQKNRARRALAAFQRANNSCFGSSDRAAALREKLRKYPGLNTPLGIPGVFFGVFPHLVYFWPFWGYFAWCIPKVTAPTRGTFALK
jgi:hypothetical protein